MNPDPYKTSAKKYDRFVGPVTAALRRIQMTVYPPRAGMSVLDVGCGTGTSLKLYHKAGCRVSGIDSSPAMIKEAGIKTDDQAELLVCDATTLPYPDKCFDLVTGMLTFHEMPPAIRSQVMAEMIRVLKQQGRMLIIDYHPGSIQFSMGLLNRAVIYFFEMAAGREHFMNFRDFLANNGIPGLIDGHRLTMEKAEIVSGGTIGAYLLRAE